jgi:Ca2+-binding RTX toxin-like protein
VTVAENQTSVVTVSASDSDGDSLSYSLSGTDASSFSINSSGVITFNSAPDYETKNSFSITVNVNDGTDTTSQALTVNVSNINEAPTISSLSSSITVAEGQTSVVTVSASDPEGESLTYSLTGTDASSLSINSSGVITFNSAPDYETKTSYSVTVNVSDGTSTTSQALTINISNINEAPTISGLASSITVNENQTSVVTVSASDPDSSISYSVSGTDASSFSINSSGVITFNSAPDYETKSSYSVTVNVSDGSNTTSQSVTVSITNLNDNNPSISGLSSSVSIDENDSSVVTVSASDADGESVSYSLTGTDASSLSINSSGVLTFNSAPDYETKTSYSITVNVSDGTNTTSQELTININDITESGLAPGSYDPNVYVTAETLNGGTGNDTMYGYDGDDTINGNDGDDILWGGAGADILTGGNGADRFAVKEACTPNGNWANVSVVTDFTDGQDKILLLDGLSVSDISIHEATQDYPDVKGPNIAIGDTYLTGNSHSLLIIKANSFTLTSDDFETGSSGTSYCD